MRARDPAQSAPGPVRAPLDSFGVRQAVTIGGRRTSLMNIGVLRDRFPAVDRLPMSLRIVLENLLRHEDGRSVTHDHIAAVAERAAHWGQPSEILFQPTRVLMQDYSGLVALIDLATMRDRVAAAGRDPGLVNPVKRVDLIVDHSLIANHAGTRAAFDRNLEDEYRQNRERYEFLKWAQASLANVNIVPPGNGIIHQINLEHLAEVISLDASGGIVHPETCIGTDSHTTMINGLGVLGWGVGGIEAEASMLGEPVSMLVPDVIGVRLVGSCRPGILSTDIVLTITQKLRETGVVDKFVEFFGDGVATLSVADRATIANMAPEYGATCGLFPVDRQVLDYLEMTGRSRSAVARVADYARLSGLWADTHGERNYADIVEIDLAVIGQSISGPSRPHDRMGLAAVPETVRAKTGPQLARRDGGLQHGDLVIASITSCTNTSNPHNMIAAGLLARNAAARGLQVPWFVKTTFTPGSRTVPAYLAKAGLMDPLVALGFAVVGFGCATCVGNSGMLDDRVRSLVEADGISVASVLSGNRNFEGRVHELVKLNYLASPPLVIAYALLGSMDRDIETAALGRDSQGHDVFLKDIWPDSQEINDFVNRYATKQVFRATNREVVSGGVRWDALNVPPGVQFNWDDDSSYVGSSPFIATGDTDPAPKAIESAAVLLCLGDNITTDHISPVGAIQVAGPAANFLLSRGVLPEEFNAYGARRGNTEVMARGTFANVRLRNELVQPLEGGWTVHAPTGTIMSVFDAATRYRDEGTATVVIAGKNYGAGSARDWAAKGTLVLGIRAVIAESFERIHRANLVLMGVLPIELPPATTRADLKIDSESTVTIAFPAGGFIPQQQVQVFVDHPRHGRRDISTRVRIDTAEEARYFADGGILNSVLRRIVDSPTPTRQKATTT